MFTWSRRRQLKTSKEILHLNAQWYEFQLNRDLAFYGKILKVATLKRTNKKWKCSFLQLHFYAVLEKIRQVSHRIFDQTVVQDDRWNFPFSEKIALKLNSIRPQPREGLGYPVLMICFGLFWITNNIQEEKYSQGFMPASQKSLFNNDHH